MDAVDEDLSAVELLDGRTVSIRAISPSDIDALVRFHEGLTRETTRLRFFILHPHLTPNEVERFTHVDHHDREALVALAGPDIIAVGRFDRLPGSGDAEVAFVVADGWQAHGVGTRLLEQLAHRARAEGVTGFVADTLGENHRMREVFRHSGLKTESHNDAGVVHVVLDLRLEAGPSMEVDGDGLEVLDRDECLRLLASAALGRIGFTSGALPAVWPVNFHLDGERILVRTSRGSTLDAALQNAVVAFEVDEFDPIRRSGWSVAVTGVAAEVSDPTELEPAPHDDDAIIAISTELVSGRRTTDGSLAVRR
jgi:GNAT superfamily N-acetyltransferase